ncbi:FAD-dependent oxidoreductase [Pseudonocardia humida]|uniref:FAD-binding protein n=1 Tax=Pseudonocardia humida TaxID=2800819 RepID=A0ABT0ZXN8_9PSEU|nr:FAD-dependent oxidoreductase [Pseudonocardia humida]MCO1655509.1 FAD-binding protein [Pseudonocardia humida]
MPDTEAVDVVDVVVVGSGAAALTGAYTAAARGLRVLVLEKTGHLGGTSAYSGATIWLPGNGVLRRAGVPDTVEDGLRYLRHTVGDRTPAAQQEAYVRTGPELVEFLERDPDVEFEVLPFPDYFDAPGRGLPTGRGICPLPLRGDRLGDRLGLLRPTIAADQFGKRVTRSTLFGGQSLVGRLLLALDRTGGAEIRTGTALHSLAVTDGRVRGVRVGPDGSARVDARVGVLVAAGGYEGDPARRRELHGLPGADWTSAAPGSNTGDALAALQAVGAEVDLLDEAWWCPATLFPNGRAAFTLGLHGGIFVDPDGRRFGNESLPYDRMGHLLHDRIRRHGPGTAFWWVFDSRTPSVPGICQPLPDPDEFRAAGLWRSAGTARELAAAIGVPPTALHETVERFNGFAASGTDADFHRGEDDYDRFFATGTGPNPALVALEQGPLHAVRIVLGDLGTKGGARIDPCGRVLATDGRAIPGLYAAGNSAASVAGHVYPGPGVPLGSGMVFAYRAAVAMSEAAHAAARPVG